MMYRVNSRFSWCGGVCALLALAVPMGAAWGQADYVEWNGVDRWNEPGAWKEWDPTFSYWEVFDEDWDMVVPGPVNLNLGPITGLGLGDDATAATGAQPLFSNSGSSTMRVDSKTLGKNHWEIYSLTFARSYSYEYVPGDYEMVEVDDGMGGTIEVPDGDPPSKKITISAGNAYTIEGNPLYIGAGGIQNVSGTVQTINTDIWLWDDATINGGVGLRLGGTEINNSRDGAQELTFDGWTHVGNVDGSGPVIRGDGDVVFAGEGTFLFVPNEYTGTTVFDGGKVMIGSNTAFGVGGVIRVEGTDNRISAFADPVQIANNFELYGDINFGGTTFQYDSGGPITVTGDIELFNDDRAITTEHGTDTTIAGRIETNDNALEIYNFGSSNLVINGAIGSDALSPVSLVKDGPGTLRLNAANTFDGDIFTHDGTIELGHAGAFGAADLLTVEGRTFLRALVPFTVSADVVLNDDLEVLDGSALIFDGDVDVTTPLTLRIRNPQAATLISENSTVTLASNLTVTGPDDLVIDAPIVGAGNLTKTGQGELWLGGVNTFVGTTAVTGGGTLRIYDEGVLPGNVSLLDSNLAVDAGSTINGDVSIGRNSILSGAGDINGNLTVASLGSVAPGSSIGTLNIDGDATWQNGSNLVIEFDTGGNSDMIVVSGAATFQDGAQIVMQQIGGGFIGGDSQFNIIEAGTLTIADPDNLFTHANGSLFLTFEVIDSGIASGNLAVLTERAAFSTQAQGGDNQAIAAQLDSLMGSSLDAEAVALLTALDLSSTTAGFNQALQQLSPSLYSSVVDTSFEATRTYHRNLHEQARNARLGRSGLEYDPFGERPSNNPFASSERDMRYNGYNGGRNPGYNSGRNPGYNPGRNPGMNDEVALENRWNIFVTPYGLFDDVDTTDQRTGLSANTGGFVIGADYSFNEHFFVGISGGYAVTDVDFNQGRGDGTIDTFRVGPYAGLTWRNLFIDASATYGNHSNDHDVDVNINGFQQQKSADYDVDDYALHLGAGIDLELADRRTVISPVAAFDYIHYDRDGFTESGGGATNLAVSGQTVDSLQSTLGVRLEQRYFSDGPILILGGFAGWSHEFLADDNEVTASFVGQPGTFTMEGSGPDRDSFRFGAGLSVLFNESLQGFVRYNGRFSSNQDTHGINVGVSYQF